MLDGIAAFVRIVEGIHTQSAGSDVSDWLQAGHSSSELEDLARQTPLWVRPRTAGPLTVVAGRGTANADGADGVTTGSFNPDNLYTDTYNARAFADDHWLNVRYCSAWKTWLLWNGTHWERDDDGTVVQWAKQTVKDLAKLLHGMDNDQSKALLGHIARSLSTAKLDAMLKSARSEPGIPIKPEAFDRNLWLLNCASGTINLQTGTLRQAARDDYLTRCLSLRYNPQATCPTWTTFLTRAMGGKQGLVAFLHRAIGYSLTGSTMEQCLFILHGPTKTGKSTFLNRLRALLGPYATAADMESFMHKDKTEIRNDLADLAGARVVCALEAQEGKRLNESLIKQLTGGVDQVKARFLFQDYFTYTPQFKVFLGTNHKPVIKDNDQAIWERIRLVPFVVQIPKEDRKKDFDAILQAEIEGILAWAVKGCLDWQQRGDLEPPPEVINATKEYQEESDVIGRFIAEKCVKLTRAEVRATALWSAYKDWCEQHGETWVKQTAFGRKLTEDGFGKRESHGLIYTGIGLRSEDQE
jgi:putative DNA primase/helicase